MPEPGGSPVWAGQAQRIALARAQCGTPALLAVDEPDFVQDTASEHALMRLIERLRERKAATIIAAYCRPMPEFADRLMLLRAGRIKSLGAPMGLLRAGLEAPGLRRMADIAKPFSFTRKGAA